MENSKSIVGAAFECLNAIIWKSVFYIMYRWVLFSAPYNLFSKWLRNERDVDETIKGLLELRSDDKS